MVSYAQALQFWAEKVNLPTEGKSHLLAGSVVELWEEMKCYISFSDEDVFKGIALPEEAPIIPPKDVIIEGAMPTTADPPATEATLELAEEKRPQTRSLVGRKYSAPLNL